MGTSCKKRVDFPGTLMRLNLIMSGLNGMNRKMGMGRVLQMILAMVVTNPMAGGAPTLEEMWTIIQEQQAEIIRLRQLVETGQAEVVEARKEAAEAQTVAEDARSSVDRTREQIEATALAVEEMSDTGGSGFGGWWDRTSVGGYGELHWNFYEDASDAVDFHRFVLFVNHEFNDWIQLYTELEVEHSLSGNGKPGEVELEQAFIRMDWKENFSTDAGLFLMPVGMINETHEPNTFYGVERNNIESRIIPSTWWEAGLKGTWRFGNGLAIDAGVTSGLDMDPSGEIRGGRQKVAQAINDTPGYVGRIKYTGIPGLDVGFSAYYQDDMAQSSSADIQGLLTAAHLDYQAGSFRFRALYARWDLDGTDSTQAENQYGFFLEPSYRWELDERYGDIGVYFRYSNYEYFSDSLKDNTIYEIGVNYWPTNYVVFKADLQEVSESDQYKSKGDKILNLGGGYQF